MFRQIKSTRKYLKQSITSIRNHQVTVLGSASDVGQTLCLLLRRQPNITKLIVHDSRPETPGVVQDLSHVTTNAAIKGFYGPEKMAQALQDSEIVIAAGGITQHPNSNNYTMWRTNTDFIKTFISKISRLKPMPFVGIVTEPLNSIVPMAAEIMRNHGEYEPKKLFGITNIDVMRAQTIFAAQNNLDPLFISIPVIGGHSDQTILPLLSQARPTMKVTDSITQDLTRKLRNADYEVTEAKKGFAPVLSIAYSAYLFTRSILEALDGKPAMANALVDNNDFGTEYFSGLVTIDANGVQEMKRYTNLSKYECHLLENSIEHLRKDVLKGKKLLEYEHI